MIYTKRKNLDRYLGISPEMDIAIRYLQSADLRTLVKGRNEIDGDNVFVNRFDYQTMPQEQAIWEGHIQYGDIHVLLSGQEQIGVTNVEMLQETVRKPEEDFVGYDGPVMSWFPMTSEDILIVYPEDAHMVKVINGESTLVEKACYKFKV
jgi:YhcH/YjgK/YiaL family protein